MAEVQYATRLELPYAIERGRTNTLRCPLYHQGALVAPTSGTFTLRDSTGTTVVSGAVTVSNGIAQYAVSSLSSYAYGDGWQTSWALLMPDGVTHTYRCSAALVRTAWHPTVTDADLFRRMSSLAPTSRGQATTLQSYQTHIDEAGVEIQRRLLQAGRRPWLVVDPTDLREPHLLLTLALVCEDLSTRLNQPSVYMDLAKGYRQQFDHAWWRVRLAYDQGEDGMPDSRDRRSARHAGFWLTSRN